MSQLVDLHDITKEPEHAVLSSKFPILASLTIWDHVVLFCIVLTLSVVLCLLCKSRCELNMLRSIKKMVLIIKTEKIKRAN
jgi:hypothetical protein